MYLIIYPCALVQVPSKQPWQRLLGGAFAGAASRTLVAPLERLRTIAMAAPHAMPPSHVVNVALRDGGPIGLFRGNTATLVKIMPASAVQFAVYEALRDALKAMSGRTSATQAGPKGAGPEHFIAGFVAGAAQCLVSHPLETIRTLMSVPGCTQGSFLQACSCHNGKSVSLDPGSVCIFGMSLSGWQDNVASLQRLWLRPVQLIAVCT